MMLGATLLVLATILCSCLSVVPVPTDAPPRGPAVGIGEVTVAEDGRSVLIGFTGGKEFAPDDPCSVAYEGTAKVVGDELEIGVYALPHPEPLPEGLGCDLVGYGRSLELELPEPFHGVRVRDLVGQVFLLGPPPGLAEIGALPDGWELRHEETLPESPAPRWMRVFSPQAIGWPPPEGASAITLIQAFGGPVNTTGGEPAPPVKVNGETARFYLWEPSGEMIVVWSLGEDELALVGFLHDFTEAEFVRLAESVVLPAER